MKQDKKYCWKCERDLDVSQFHRDKSKSDGLNGRCICCQKAYNREYSIFRKIRKMYEEYDRALQIVKYNPRKITYNCDYCCIERNIGYLIWGPIWDDTHYTTICRTCILNAYLYKGNLYEMLFNADIEYTLGMRENLIEMEKYEKYTDKDWQKLWDQENENTETTKTKKQWIDKDKWEMFKLEMGFIDEQ